MHRSIAAVLALATSLSACSGEVAGEIAIEIIDQLICEQLRVSDSTIVVDKVRSTDGTELGDVVLARLVTGSLALDDDAFSKGASNINDDGQTVRCTVPCSFEVPGGNYTFRVSAPGHRAQVVSADVEGQWSGNESCRNYTPGRSTVQPTGTPALLTCPKSR